MLHPIQPSCRCTSHSTCRMAHRPHASHHTSTSKCSSTCFTYPTICRSIVLTNSSTTTCSKVQAFTTHNQGTATASKTEQPLYCSHKATANSPQPSVLSNPRARSKKATTAWTPTTSPKVAETSTSTFKSVSPKTPVATKKWPPPAKLAISSNSSNSYSSNP